MRARRKPARIDPLEQAVRLGVYDHFIRTGAPPTRAMLSAELGVRLGEVGDAFRRLAAQHVLVLERGGREIRMAAPFSAVPTGFRVNAGGAPCWANCAWDALGIPALLERDADIGASCGDCGLPVTLRVRKGRLLDQEGVVHLAVPAAEWWRDIGFT